MEFFFSGIASIFVGVISGVITSIFLWIATKLLKNTVLPWYESVVYRGQKISGDWEGYALFPKPDNKDKVSEEKCSTIHLDQNGHTVSGYLELLKQPNGDKESKRFKLNGSFYENSLVLTNEVEDKTRFGLGACVFRLVNDGQRLEGYWTAVSSATSNVFSTTEYWKRKK